MREDGVGMAGHVRHLGDMKYTGCGREAGDYKTFRYRIYLNTVFYLYNRPFLCRTLYIQNLG